MTTMKHARQLLIAAILLLTLTLTTRNLFSKQVEAQNASNITIQDLVFHPQNLVVAKGDTITWTNNDSLIYTLWFVHEENGSTYLLSDPILPQESWSHTFHDPTKLKYYSQERLWITGRLRTVKVLGDINWDSLVDIHDLYALGEAYQTTPDTPNWNEDADINFDNAVNKSDLAIMNSHYGETDP